MAEENKMHAGTCGCGPHSEEGMMGHMGSKNRHKLLKFVVIVIFMFMSFSIGVQFGEIKGALGITPFPKYQQPMRAGYTQNQMMYGNQGMVPGMMQQ